MGKKISMIIWHANKCPYQGDRDGCSHEKFHDDVLQDIIHKCSGTSFPNWCPLQEAKEDE